MNRIHHVLKLIHFGRVHPGGQRGREAFLPKGSPLEIFQFLKHRLQSTDSRMGAVHLSKATSSSLLEAVPVVSEVSWQKRGVGWLCHSWPERL